MAQRTARAAWELAGLTTAEGALHRAAPATGWRAPGHVAADNGMLLWTSGSAITGVVGNQGNEVVPTARLLEDFTALWDSDDDKIVAYAQRNGVLNLCAKHDKPCTHLPPWVFEELDLTEAQLDDIGTPGWCSPRRRGLDGPHCEPLGRWRDYSKQAHTILVIAAKLYAPRNRSTASVEEWEPLAELHARMVHDGVVRDGSHDRFEIQEAHLRHSVDRWLRLGGVEVSLEPGEDRPHVSLGTRSWSFESGSLFGALAMQLVLAVCSSKGFVWCDSCGMPFTPQRMNSSGPHYCKKADCQAAPKRAYKARKREQRQC